MNSRERLCAALGGRDMDRVPMLEIGFWPETLARWRGEGMPACDDPQAYFGLDDIAFFEIDGSLRLPSGVVSEDERQVVFRDGNGLTMRSLKGASGAPEIQSAALREPAEWEAFRGRLIPSLDRLYPTGHEPITGKPTGCADQLAYYHKSVARGAFTVYTPVEPVWYYLRLLMEVDALMGIASDPEGVECVLADYARFNAEILKLLYAQGMRFDAVWVFSDLCYKNGMLFSPAFYRKYAQKYLAEFVALCHEMGSFFIYHSDGNLRELLPLLYEAGIDCMQPLEARAGNDVRALVSQYEGRLSFMGNISADRLAGPPEGVVDEVSSKVTCAKRYHRYIFHSDHSVPPSVSLANYRLALETARAAGRYLL